MDWAKCCLIEIRDWCEWIRKGREVFCLWDVGIDHNINWIRWHVVNWRLYDNLVERTDDCMELQNGRKYPNMGERSLNWQSKEEKQHRTPKQSDESHDLTLIKDFLNDRSWDVQCSRWRLYWTFTYLHLWPTIRSCSTAAYTSLVKTFSNMMWVVRHVQPHVVRFDVAVSPNLVLEFWEITIFI